MFVGGQANGSLEALTADPCAAITAKESVLGCARIVAIKVGGSEVLDEVKFEE
jgi:hypothetical protein